MAGGCVRDRLLGHRPKDYDIATNAEPSEISTVFKQKNVKTVPTGIEHGTVTVIFGGQPLEITTLRRDVTTDGRRATVSFGHSFEEDSLRRDFTINAMYEDVRGKIYDFHGGQFDLNNHILRFVGDAETRIREDYLRILRLFRFWARYNFRPAPGTLDAIAARVKGLEQISSERVTSELWQILECDDVSEVVASLLNTKTLSVVFRVESPGRFQTPKTMVTLESRLNRPLARIAQLIWDFPEPSDKKSAIQHLRLSRLQQDKLDILLEEPIPSDVSDPGEVYTWLDHIEAKVGKDAWSQLLYPAWTILRPDPQLNSLDVTIKTYSALRYCPIDGQFLMQNLDIQAGPQLGALIFDLKQAYRRGQWRTKDEALAWAAVRLKERGEPQS
jgi:poly(A) polymerase